MILLADIVDAQMGARNDNQQLSQIEALLRNLGVHVHFHARTVVSSPWLATVALRLVFFSLVSAAARIYADSISSPTPLSLAQSLRLAVPRWLAVMICEWLSYVSLIVVYVAALVPVAIIAVNLGHGRNSFPSVYHMGAEYLGLVFWFVMYPLLIFPFIIASSAIALDKSRIFEAIGLGFRSVYQRGWILRAYLTALLIALVWYLSQASGVIAFGLSGSLEFEIVLRTTLSALAWGFEIGVAVFLYRRICPRAEATAPG